MKSILLLLVLFFSIPLFAVEEPVVLKTPEGDIHGILRIPEIKQPMPVAIIIAGSGPTDRDGNNQRMKNNSLKMLAQGLNKNGIATLNFDKRMIGESIMSGIKEEDLIFEDYIDDVKAWIDLLREDVRFSMLVVIGHSEGSLVGMAASENNPKVDKYISVAGVAVSIDEILKRQLGEQSAQLLDMATPYLDQLKRGELIEDVPEDLHMLFRPSVQPYMISWFKYNPSEIIGKLTIPVLIINGTMDIQVREDQAELLAKANLNAKKVIVKKMNHVLKECDTDSRIVQIGTYINPDLPLRKGLVSAIVSFIKKR